MVKLGMQQRFPAGEGDRRGVQRREMIDPGAEVPATEPAAKNRHIHCNSRKTDCSGA